MSPTSHCHNNYWTSEKGMQHIHHSVVNLIVQLSTVSTKPHVAQYCNELGCTHYLRSSQVATLLANLTRWVQQLSFLLPLQLWTVLVQSPTCQCLRHHVCCKLLVTASNVLCVVFNFTALDESVLMSALSQFIEYVMKKEILVSQQGMWYLGRALYTWKFTEISKVYEC